MRLIEDEEEEKELPAPAEPPALEPPNSDEPSPATRVETQRTAPPLIRWIVVGVIIVIIALLVLLLARWIYHKAHHHAETGVGTATQQPSQSSGATTQSGENAQSGSAPNNIQSPNGAKLPNNGPGNVAAVFAISTAAGAVLHYTIKTKRQTS